MISQKKLQTMKYIQKEFDSLKNEPITPIGLTVRLNENYKGTLNIFHWKITLTGPYDLPYAGGKFLLTIDFDEDYPNKKPEIRFCNKIYHLNAHPTSGHISISTLNQWIPKTPILTIISSIYALFYDQNPKSPYSGQMAREYEHNRDEFNKKAKEWTQKYASKNLD